MARGETNSMHSFHPLRAGRGGRWRRGAALRSGRRLLAALGVPAALGVSSLPGSVRAQQTSSFSTISDSAAVGRLAAMIRVANPELASRRASLDAARARLGATGFAGPLTLSGEAEGLPSVVDFRRAQSVRVDLTREFLSGGRRAAQRAVAEADVRQAELEVELAEQVLVARADQLLTSVAGSAAIARRLAAEDSLLSGAEEALRARFTVGDARYVDVLRLRTERLRVQTERAAAVTEVRVGRQSILALVGAGIAGDSAARVGAAVDSLIVREVAEQPRRPLPAPPPVDALVAASGALRRAETDVTRAEAALRLVRAEQRPVVSASLGVQRFAGEDGYPLGPTLGAAVSLPFTARRANAAAATAAERQIAAARAERAAVLAAVLADVGGSLARYEAARERIAVYNAALFAGAQQERESALASYRSGELTLVELLDFERALARAEVERLRSRIEAADALADLIAGVADGSAHSTEQPILR